MLAGEVISIAAMLAAVGVSIWLLDWAQRGWREIAREPVEAWGEAPFVDEKMRPARKSGRGESEQGGLAGTGHVRTHDGAASSR